LNQSRKSPQKFVKFETNKFTKRMKNKKKFTIDSNDLTSFLKNNRISRSRSGTPQIKNYKRINLDNEKQLRSLNGQPFASKYSEKSYLHDANAKTPIKPENSNYQILN
jgi:hypothetical protein